MRPPLVHDLERECRASPYQQTFPEPVTPRVASNASVPSPPWGARTPSTSGTTRVQWKTSNWVASSSKTWVKANFSIARRRSLGGFSVMCVGGVFSLDGSSTAKNLSADCEPPAGGGRKRRKTWKRLWGFCDVAVIVSIDEWWGNWTRGIFSTENADIVEDWER